MPLSQPGGSGVADQGVVTYFDFTTAAAPAAPAAGKVRVYSKTSDHLTQRVSGGTETALDGAGGGAAQITGSGTGDLDFQAARTDLYSPDEWNAGTGAALALRDTGGPNVELIAHHTPAAIVNKGVQLTLGTDELKVYFAEKSSAIGQVHLGVGSTGYDVEFTEAGAAIGNTNGGRWKFADDGGNTSIPSLGIPRKLAADPSVSVIEGETYYNTTTHKHRGYNGTIWEDLAAGAGGSGSLYGVDTTNALNYLDKHDALDGTVGDDFTGALNTGLWTRRNITSGMETTGINGTAMQVALTNGGAAMQYFQTQANADFDRAVKISFKGNIDSGQQMFGIAACDSGGAGRGILAYGDGNVYGAVIAANIYSSNFGYIYNSQGFFGGGFLWLRLKYVQSTHVFTVYASGDGLSWGNGLSSTVTLTITEVAIGRFLGNFNNSSFLVDWFNKVTP